MPSVGAGKQRGAVGEGRERALERVLVRLVSALVPGARLAALNAVALAARTA